MTIIDPLTVDLTTSRPNFRLLEQLAHPNYSIIAPGSEPTREPIGTGPFKLEHYQRNERISVIRNQLYWGRKSELQRLTFLFMPDETTRLLALRSGQTDMILDLPNEQVDTVRRLGFNVIESPVGRVATIFLNIHGRPPHDLLANQTIRKAIAMSIDRTALLERLWGSRGRIVSTMTPPTILGKHASRVEGINYQPRAASSLLNREGWHAGEDGIRKKHGRRLTLTLIAWPEFSLSTQEFLQEELRKAGIELTIPRQLDMPAYRELIDRGAFDVDLEGPNQNDANPISLAALRFYRPSGVPSSVNFAPGGRFDEVIEQGLAELVRDGVQRRSAEAQKILIDDETIVIPLGGLTRLTATRAGIRGFVAHPSQINLQWSGVKSE